MSSRNRELWRFLQKAKKSPEFGINKIENCWQALMALMSKPSSIQHLLLPKNSDIASNVVSESSNQMASSLIKLKMIMLQHLLSFMNLIGMI